MSDGGPRNVQVFGGAIALADLFPDEWMVEHTELGSIEEFIEADDAAIPADASVSDLSPRRWNDHVAATTEFDSWSEMVSRALESYAA